MGLTVGNTFVRTEDQQAVIAALQRCLRPEAVPGKAPFVVGFQQMLAEAKYGPCAYIAPPLNGWVGVFDQTLEERYSLSPELAVELSRQLGTAVLSFVLTDGDFFAYALAVAGELRDEYEYFWDLDERSRTEYELGRSLAGNPAELAAASGMPDLEDSLRQALTDEDLGATEVFEGIAEAIQIVNWHVSYRQLAGEKSPPDVEGWEDFAFLWET